MADKIDCRSCKNYIFDRDNEIESFICNKGYFDFIDEGDKMVGKMPERGSPGPNPPCNGLHYSIKTKKVEESRRNVGKLLRKRSLDEFFAGFLRELDDVQKRLEQDKGEINKENPKISEKIYDLLSKGGLSFEEAIQRYSQVGEI